MAFRSLVGKSKGKFVSGKRWEREREIVERRINKLGQEMRKAIRSRDAARSDVKKKNWQRFLDAAREEQQSQLKIRGKLERQGPPVPKGRRVEVTLRFRDTIPRGRPGRGKNRLRMLKVSAQITKKGVTKAQIERAVEDAIRSGRKTRGIQLKLADWQAGRDAVVRGKRKVLKSSGSLKPREGLSLQAQLRPFAGLLRKGALRREEVTGVSKKRSGRARAKGSTKRRAR